MKTLVRFTAVFLGFALLATKASALPDYSALLKTMGQCETSADCAVAEGICGGWIAINKRSEADYADLLVKIRPAASCPVAQVTPKPAVAECSNNFCEAR